AVREGLPAQRLPAVKMKKLDLKPGEPPPGYKPEVISPEESVGEPIEQTGGITHAVKPSVPQVEERPATQRVETGAGGAGSGAGDSDLSGGTPQGEGQQRPVSPQVRPRAQAPQVEAPKEEQKQREPESMSVEDLTDEELQQQINKAEEEFKQ